MTRSDDVAIGSSWRYGNLVYVIRARRPVEPGYPAWSARHLVLAVPRGEDPHPLDWIPDTWLRRYLTPVAADSTRRSPEPVVIAGDLTGGPSAAAPRRGPAARSGP